MPKAASPNPPQPSEAQFMASVMDYAKLRNWLVFHDHDSRRNTAGLPDLLMVRPPRLVFAELKRADGKLRADQLMWLTALGQCGPRVESYLWRPDDWPDIEKTLR